ncbi:MAG: hypothetical protein IPJ65_40255 [Archangiaceae bacterium]|nr:hypothetical protein [Archangiaceae bacterium]
MNRLALVSLVLLACAHAPAENAGPPDDDSPVVTPQQTPWKDMTGQQRGRYMAKVVLPKLRPVFQAFDGEKFAKVTCATCHGEHGKQNEFKMPSAELPSLPDSPEVFMATVMKEQPEMVKFMGEKVVPMTAELLGIEAFNPQAPKEGAFGCHGCHTLKSSK